MYQTTLRILSETPFAQAAAEAGRAHDLLSENGFDVQLGETLEGGGDLVGVGAVIVELGTRHHRRVPTDAA